MTKQHFETYILLI